MIIRYGKKKVRLMKKFIINIWAYNHHAKFTVESEDSPTDLEESILDKLGRKEYKLGISRK
jgi:hypothetical protein